MGKRTPQSASCCCKMEDCESSVTMRVRCRRGQLLAALPVLAILSFMMNFLLLHSHWKNQMAPKAKAAPPNRGPKRRAYRGNTVAAKRGVQIEPVNASMSPDAFFSACLQIKDDNEILNEWLAYHYFVLKLRHLIVAVDPLSSESPSEILRKWRNFTELEIVEWHDPDYMPGEFLRDGRPPRREMQKAKDFAGSLSEPDLIEIVNHRYRQRVFLAQCMKANRALNHSWVIHIDTDEYVVPSKLLRQMKPDYVKLHPMDKPNSVLDLLQQVVSKTSSYVNYPCISMLRVLFGSIESHREDRDVMVPEPFNSTAFETLRWRYHGLPHNMSVHGNPKVILDVAAIPDRFLPDVVFSIHRPVTEFCSRNNDLTFSNFRKQPIAVNHYLGSWERYSGRLDKRRSRAKYDQKANQRRGKDDGVRPWLKGFLELMGETKAIQLLGEDYLARKRPASKRRTNATSPASIESPSLEKPIVLDLRSAIAHLAAHANITATSR